jgi:hypothetical protein
VKREGKGREGGTYRTQRVKREGKGKGGIPYSKAAALAEERLLLPQLYL